MIKPEVVVEVDDDFWFETDSEKKTIFLKQRAETIVEQIKKHVDGYKAVYINYYDETDESEYE